MPAIKGSTPWNKGKKGVQKSTRRMDDSLVFVEDASISRQHVKRRILEQKLIEYRCLCCGIGPEWNGKPMPLLLDHINGINNDHRLDNLRFVCSNCDTQLPTYKSRGRDNNKGKSKVSDEKILTAYNNSANIRQTLIEVGLAPKGENYTRVKKLISGTHKP
jgi:hypothetical protein